MQPIYVSKNLSVASSTGVGSITSAGVATLKTSDLGMGRRISVWSSGGTDISTSAFVITGTRDVGGTLTETLIGSTGSTPAATTQDFRTVTSISVSGISTNVKVGTTTVGGTPWISVNRDITPTLISYNVTLTSTQNSMSAALEYTLDDLGPLNTNPNYTAPLVIVSTTTSSATNVLINFPITAWRVSLTSTAAGAGSVYATALQAGR